MAHHGRGMAYHGSREVHTIGMTHGEEAEMESLREGFEEYKKECEQNRELLKERFETRKIRETKHLEERYAEKKKQFEENKQRLNERYEERKSRK